LKAFADTQMPFMDLADPNMATNPFDTIRRLAKDHWIARTTLGYLLLRYRDCQEVLRNSDFRVPHGLGLVEQGITDGPAFDLATELVLGLEGEKHRRIRRLAQPAFSRLRVEALRPFAKNLLVSLLTDVEMLGHADMALLADEFTARMICEMLGFPEADWAQVGRWAGILNQIFSVSVIARRSSVPSGWQRKTPC